MNQQFRQSDSLFSLLELSKLACSSASSVSRDPRSLVRNEKNQVLSLLEKIHRVKPIVFRCVWTSFAAYIGSWSWALDQYSIVPDPGYHHSSFSRSMYRLLSHLPLFLFFLSLSSTRKNEGEFVGWEKNIDPRVILHSSRNGAIGLNRENFVVETFSSFLFLSSFEEWRSTDWEEACAF